MPETQIDRETISGDTVNKMTKYCDGIAVMILVVVE